MINTYKYLNKRFNICSNWYSVYIVYETTIIYRRFFGVLVTTKPSTALPSLFKKSDDLKIQDIINKHFDGKL